MHTVHALSDNCPSSHEADTVGVSAHITSWLRPPHLAVLQEPQKETARAERTKLLDTPEVMKAMPAARGFHPVTQTCSLPAQPPTRRKAEMALTTLRLSAVFPEKSCLVLLVRAQPGSRTGDGRLVQIYIPFPANWGI